MKYKFLYAWIYHTYLIFLSNTEKKMIDLNWQEQHCNRVLNWCVNEGTKNLNYFLIFTVIITT